MAERQDLELEPLMLTRAVAVAVRGVDALARTAEFVAATEDVVDLGSYREVLRMKGVDLRRFATNPIVLNAHKRYDVRDIVGRAPGPVASGAELLCRITFSQATEAGRVAWELVEEGTLRTLSIGYRPSKVRFLATADDVDGLGPSAVRGPNTYVALEWELLEFSVAPVPADARALKRALALWDGVRSAPAAIAAKPSPATPGRTWTSGDVMRALGRS